MEQLDRTIIKIHNYIYANEGLSNSEVLNEFLKIFYCKIIDEQEKNKLKENLSKEEIKNYLEKLYDNFKKKMNGIIPDDDSIKLRNDTLKFIIDELSSISFVDSSSDVKGHILQKIIDRSYRESRGQFFTPPQVVDFIVKMIKPQKGESGCDPASGTGGFMFSAIQYISKNENITKKDIKNISFYDISKDLIKLVAMRLMFEFSISDGNFFVKDSIKEDFDEKFDYIMTNPPFGTQGKISSEEILKKYNLGMDENNNKIRPQVPDILFVERIIKILKDGGRAAIVLPDGDFENPSLNYFRKYVIENAKIDAIISLPDGTFIPYGTGVQSSILFITKKNKNEISKLISENYKVRFGKISKLGYTFSKHSKDEFREDGIIDEDYTTLLSDIDKCKSNNNTYEVSISEIINNDYNMSETLYSPTYNNMITNIKAGKYKSLKELVDFRYKKIKIDKEQTYRYVEIADVSSFTSEIINCSEMLGDELPSRASYILEKDDIIVATSGNAIGTSKQSKALVGDKYAGCICTNGFTVFKAKGISRYYLMYFFNSDCFLNQVLKYKYGSAIPTISRDDFENILVPIPNKNKLEKIENNIQKALKLREEAAELMNAMIE